MTIVILLFVWIITASMTPFAQFKISYSVQEVFNEKNYSSDLSFCLGELVVQRLTQME